MRRVRGELTVAVLVRGARRSLPKALLGAQERLEEAAERAAAEWVGAALGRGLARRDALGVALVEAGSRTLAVWFHRFELERENPGGGAPDHSPTAVAASADLGGWRLEWLPARRAVLELAQLEERRLVERVLLRSGLRATLARELAPRDRRERWLFAALAGTALIGPAAALLGWLDGNGWSPDWLPRVAAAGALGGLTSAALRTTAAARTPVIGAAVGAIAGTLAALFAAGGGSAAITVAPGAALAVAWAAGFLERVRLSWAAPPPTGADPE